MQALSKPFRRVRLYWFYIAEIHSASAINRIYQTRFFPNTHNSMTLAIADLDSDQESKWNICIIVMQKTFSQMLSFSHVLFGSGYKCHEISNHRQIIFVSNPCICNSTFKNFFRATGDLFILGRSNSSIALDKIQNLVQPSN